MSRVWTAIKLLLVLGAVGGLLFGGAALLLSPDDHGGGSPLTDNPAARALRDVIERDDAVIDGVEAAHREFNAEIWGDGGDLAAACSELEETIVTAEDHDGYGRQEVAAIREVSGLVCDRDGSDLDLHDAVADLEGDLRAG